MITYEKIYDLRVLLPKLDSLKDKGYIFRGIANAKYMLLPNAFRQESLDKMVVGFPVDQKVINEQWINSSELRGIMEDYTIPQLLKNSTLHTQINRLCQYIVYMMRYNYWLHFCWEQNKDLNLLKEEESVLLNSRSSKTYWINKKDFLYFFSAFYPSLFTFTTMDDSILRHQPICENFAGIDETRPQHYGLRDGNLGTTVLDWSLNPLHALYFAINPDQAIHTKESRSYFAICALRVLNNSSPINLVKCGTSNLRAVAQEGIFTRFSNACSYFMLNSSFPCIESFLGHPSFEVIKFNIEKKPENFIYFKDILKINGINKQKLFPDI